MLFSTFLYLTKTYKTVGSKPRYSEVIALKDMIPFYI